MMLGLLLARAGVSVVVLEKHADFLRDFRGDTIHPSTLEVMHELGVLDAFLKLPHQEVRELAAQIGDVTVRIADFTHLPTRCRFLALMPQWDFLDFLAGEAARYSGFRLQMRTEITGLIEESGHVVGVRALTQAGPIALRADLVVAADGRYSLVRTEAKLPVQELGAPMDVLWFRLARSPSEAGQTMARFDAAPTSTSETREYGRTSRVIVSSPRFPAATSFTGPTQSGAAASAQSTTTPRLSLLTVVGATCSPFGRPSAVTVSWPVNPPELWITRSR